MRLPFCSRRERLLSSVSAGLTGNSASKSCTFLNNSELCRRLGLISRMSERGKKSAWCKLNTAVVVLFPLCLQQFSKSRFLCDCKTCSCQGSGWKPNFCRAKNTGSAYTSSPACCCLARSRRSMCCSRVAWLLVGIVGECFLKGLEAFFKARV
jgi:hypothetical protein